ncbi:protein kinase family protein [Streptomyces albogriseolus]|uniref:protein kinase family protein n=1 Tax=Streptomyces albogriseolus TaxID=1887 RepID=UPI0035DB1E41
MEHGGVSRGARLAAHGAVSASLALCDDRRLRELVDAGQPLGSGIGGERVLLDVDGTPVFVKQVRLTDLERRPENLHSTRNLFELPLFCHHGVGTIGGPGFGAWRELAAHRMTTDWVIAGQYEGFPLLHHWRVLPDSGRPLPEELADLERAVAYWGGGAEVRHRIEALQRSSASLLLFMEYLPRNLHDWLGERMSADEETAERACAMVDDELRAGIAFMNAGGLLHFDAHFENILTDGRRLFFTDFGLAFSSRFELARAEADFLEHHRIYDRCYAVTHLVNWLTVALLGHEPEERRAFVRACAKGVRPRQMPTAIADVVARYAPVAETMGDFCQRFRTESRTVPFPFAAVRERLEMCDQ